MGAEDTGLVDLDKLKISEVKKMNPISEKQKGLLQKLAQTTGTNIGDIESLSSVEAGRLIDKLLAKRNGNGNGNGTDWDLRDRKIAYGMATKLVFERFLQSSRDYRKSKSFWNEVDAFFKAYQLRQEQAVKA